MTSYILDSASLDSLLVDTLTRAGVRGFLSSYRVLNLCYVFGFRINELRLIDFWSNNGNGTVTCPTSKNGFSRIIDYSELDLYTQHYLSVQDGTFHKQSYSSYERLFTSCTGLWDVKIKNKSCGTHLFRHNFIKKQVDKGNSFQDVADLVGLKSSSVVGEYYNSIITAYEITPHQ